MNEDELRLLLDEVIREGVNGVTPLTGPAFGTTFHLYPVPDSDEVEVRTRIKQECLPCLTMKDVERVIDDVEAEIAFECVTKEELGGARMAIEAIRQRLRQRVNGDTCNREEG